MKKNLTSNKISSWQGKKQERNQTWLAKKYQAGKERKRKEIRPSYK
jgi:hypothetical protein